jgi:hypothetical protein
MSKDVLAIINDMYRIFLLWIVFPHEEGPADIILFKRVALASG